LDKQFQQGLDKGLSEGFREDEVIRTKD
jgi:hypothetical protein